MRGALVVAGCLAALAPARAEDGGAISHTPRLNVIRQAADFELLDTHQERLRLSSLRGRVVLLSFIFTTCSSACPIVSSRIAGLRQDLRSRGLLPGKVQLLSVTVDPRHDDPQALAGYAEGFQDDASWRFLREEPARLAPVLASYGEWVRPAQGTLDHPARVYLIDARGRVREIYSLAFFSREQALIDIGILLAEKS